jgi:hypothetical protein
MRQHSSDRRERSYLRAWRKSRKLQLPSWWSVLAPGRGSKFWSAVELMRKDSGIERWDTSGMHHIINIVKGRS